MKGKKLTDKGYLIEKGWYDFFDIEFKPIKIIDEDNTWVISKAENLISKDFYIKMRYCLFEHRIFKYLFENCDNNIGLNGLDSFVDSLVKLPKEFIEKKQLRFLLDRRLIPHLLNSRLISNFICKENVPKESRKWFSYEFNFVDIPVYTYNVHVVNSAYEMAGVLMDGKPIKLVISKTVEREFFYMFSEEISIKQDSIYCFYY